MFLRPGPSANQTPPGRRFSRAARLALVLAVAWLAAVLLVGCSLLAGKIDPYGDIRQSWRADFSVSDAELAAMPLYSMTVKIDPEYKVYTGTLDLTLTASSTIPVRELYFRTYPRLLVFDGDLQLTGARIDGITVNFTQAAEGTAVRLELIKPLENGVPVNIWLGFNGSFETDRGPGTYTIFGKSEDVLTLTGFYPILAPRRGGEWALDLPHPQGDVGFQDASLYRVSLTAPVTETILATGTEVTRTVGADGWATARYALGPAREFAAFLTTSLQYAEGEALGTRVRSYYTAADQEAGRKALNDGVAALQIYNDNFGTYPFRDMVIVQAPLTYHGMEFPTVSLVGSQDYNKYVKDLENLVVHEVAHQWWYNQVGSDQVLTPWLDEGLAEYSMYVYYQGRYGKATADDLEALRWELPLSSLRKRGKDMPIGRPVVDYKEGYEPLVYGKGALFFVALRDEMGELKFGQLLREYLSRNRWKIATPAGFKALAEEISGQDLTALFDEWVGE